MIQRINNRYTFLTILVVVVGLFIPSGAMAKQKSVDKAKAYCSAAGFPAKKCSNCGKKNSKNCQCCYKAKPFWCPKGLAKAPTSYGLYKVCIKGKKSKAVARDLSKIKNAAITINPASITKAYDAVFWMGVIRKTWEEAVALFENSEEVSTILQGGSHESSHCRVKTRSWT